MTIVLETGRSIAEVARELGIGAGTLGSWVKKDHLTEVRRLTAAGWTRAMCISWSGSARKLR